MKDTNRTYANITRRVAASNLHMLNEFAPCLAPDLPEAERGAAETAQRDLHAFFATFYQALFDQPEAFGLPLIPDDALTPGEPNEKDHKQEVTRKMKKSRDGINQILDFLMHAGKSGTLAGAALHVSLDETLAGMKRSRNTMKFLQGMRLAGLIIIEDAQAWRLENTRFPAMMSALQALARVCAAHPQANIGRLNFARCDFQALTRPDYEPDVLALYRAFNETDARQLGVLHAFFTERGYHTELGMGGKFDWVVKYQGNKKVKSTPLFQVEHQERYRNPLQLQVKCASTERIAPLLPQQSETLQADFIQRAYRCRGDECGWCRNRKTLGPSIVEYQGETLTLCWYSNPTLPELTDSSAALIKEYALMHEKLAKA